MRLIVQTRKGKQISVLEGLSEDTSIEELKARFYAQCHYYSERQRFTTVEGTLLSEGTLKSNGLSNNSIIFFKDLGVQISWRLVYVLEYMGPLLILPLFWQFPKAFYGQAVSHNLTQKLGFWLMFGHFCKREFETLFIHRFSKATMPLIRLPINCCHYWIFCGVAIGYYLMHPQYMAPFNSSAINILLAAMMIICEFCNFQTHLSLRNLRPRGSKVRAIPDKWGFQYVSCANYAWETAAWLCYCILTNTLTGWIFLIVAFAQMSQWALKKHFTYRKEFSNYPKRRKAIIPFIL